MKKPKIIVLASVFGLVCTAMAADKGSLVDAAKLDGMKVFDHHGNQLGNIQRVLVDPKSGMTRYGVLEVDKAWNWDDSEVAIPWKAFTVNKPNQDDMSLSVDATKEKLQSAPRFKQGDADRIYSQEAAKPIYSYWSIYWVDLPENQQSGGAGTTGTQNTGTASEQKSPNAGNSGSSTTGSSGTSSITGSSSPSTSGSTSTGEAGAGKAGATGTTGSSGTQTKQ